jgi:release factor glutamine methyltransferase
MQEIIEEFRKKGISKEDENILLNISENNPSKYKIYAQRRLFHEPLAYIKGNVEFFGREFLVDNRVYVPTKETEQLIKLVLKELKEDSILLDVGTGSGALAITIRKENPKTQVIGSDINPHSLEVAKNNVKKHNVNIEFFESLYVEDLEISEPTHIIADLPWGDENSVLGSNSLKESKHMPSQAFFHPLGKFESYKELIESIQKKGWKSKLFFESGLITKEEIASIIPKGLEWKYIKFENYSVTTIQF